jgi:hypothetical protein
MEYLNTVNQIGSAFGMLNRYIINPATAATGFAKNCKQTDKGVLIGSCYYVLLNDITTTIQETDYQTTNNPEELLFPERPSEPPLTEEKRKQKQEELAKIEQDNYEDLIDEFDGPNVKGGKRNNIYGGTTSEDDPTEDYRELFIDQIPKLFEINKKLLKNKRTPNKITVKTLDQRTTIINSLNDIRAFLSQEDIETLDNAIKVGEDVINIVPEAPPLVQQQLEAAAGPEVLAAAAEPEVLAAAAEPEVLVAADREVVGELPAAAPEVVGELPAAAPELVAAAEPNVQAEVAEAANLPVLTQEETARILKETNELVEKAKKEIEVKIKKDPTFLENPENAKIAAMIGEGAQKLGLQALENARVQIAKTGEELKKYLSSSITFNPKEQSKKNNGLMVFVFKLNVDGEFNNTKLINDICDSNNQIISGFLFNINSQSYDSDISDLGERYLNLQGNTGDILNKLKAIYDTESDNTDKSIKSEAIYDAILSGVINCEKAQLHIDKTKLHNPCLIKTKDYFKNVELFNYSIDKLSVDRAEYSHLIHYQKLKSNYYWLDSVIDFMKNNTLYNIYFCNDIFNFNIYITRVYELTVRSKIFSKGGKTHRKRNTKRNTKRNKRNTKRKQNKRKTKRK